MKKHLLRAFLLAVAVLMPSLAKAAGWPANYEGVMLQGFYWDSYTDSKWTNLQSQADELSKNFSLIWVPNSAKAEGMPTMGYHPVYWFTNHNSSFGTEAQLRAMIKTFADKGTGIIADVIINHRSGVSNWTNFPSETWNGKTYKIGPEGICSNDEVRGQSGQATPTGANDTGEGWDGSRDLDHTNANVQACCKDYVKCLLTDYGYAGVRYDFVKGYAPRYTQMYNQANNVQFSVGEYWDGNYDAVKTWIEGTGKTSAAFDFPFKYAVNEAFASNDMTKLVWKANGTTDQPAGMIHFGYPQYAVTFIDNHDTGRDGSKFNGNVLAANAFMLSCPGTPCVFLEHWKNNKTAISAMIAARKLAGVHNMSAVKVLKSTRDCYMAEVTGKKGTLAVKIGSTMDSPAGYSASDIKASGNGYCIWVKAQGGNGGNDDPIVTPPNPGTAFKVYFDNSSSKWATPYIHYWGGAESTWPGVAMTKVSGNIWMYEVPAGTTGILFNAGDGDATKTSDFVAVENHVYTTAGDQGVYNGGSGNDDPIVTPPTPGTAFKVYFDNTASNWATPHIHYWGAAESTWPGVAMSKVSGNIWMYQVPAGTTGLLFNAGDGDATKTSDFVAVENHVYTTAGDQGVYNGGGGNDDPIVTPPTPDSAIYIIGEPAGGWKTNVGVKIPGANGLFTYDADLSAAAAEYVYFGFVTALSETAADWDAFNLRRYGSALNSELPTPDASGNTIADYYTISGKGSYPMDFPNGTSWRIAPGKYTFVVDTNAKTLKVEIGTSGIEDVETEAAEAVFYNLQGLRVENPSNGLYIRVQGNKTTKVFIR
ncbi:MAG: starch-binding protein [Muribaculaceae bacterium]|nr:starch-binding protein [Muribaculaceae bacterium]